MSDEIDWASVRLTGIELFNGETPNPITESAIIAIFELSPQAVIREITETAAALQRGEIRSGWAILRNRLEQRAEPVRNPKVKNADERAKKTQVAEAWMENAGIHVPTEDDLLDDLFGDRGILRAWRDDETLRQRMIRLWREQRPVGEHLDADLEQRMEHWRKTTGVMIGLVPKPYDGEEPPE